MDEGDIRRSNEGGYFFSNASNDYLTSKKKEKKQNQTECFQGRNVSTVPVTQNVEAGNQNRNRAKPRKTIGEYKTAIQKECKWFQKHSISQVPVTSYTEKQNRNIKGTKSIQAYRTKAIEQQMNDVSNKSEQPIMREHYAAREVQNKSDNVQAKINPSMKLVGFRSTSDVNQDVENLNQSIDQLVNKRIRYLMNKCRNGDVFILNLIGVHKGIKKSGLLIWDPINGKPVYVSSYKGEYYQATVDMLKMDLRLATRSFNKKDCQYVRLKGLNNIKILNQVRDSNSEEYKKMTNNGAQFISDLLKVSFPITKRFYNDKLYQNADDNYNLALEIKDVLKGKVEQDEKTELNVKPIKQQRLMSIVGAKRIKSATDGIEDNLNTFITDKVHYRKNIEKNIDHTNSQGSIDSELDKPKRDVWFGNSKLRIKEKAQRDITLSLKSSNAKLPQSSISEANNINNLTQVRSEKSVIANVTTKFEREKSKRMQKTTVVPTEINGEMGIPISKTHYLHIPPGSVYIGHRNENGQVVNFPYGVNEKHTCFRNGQHVIARKDGTFIPIMPMEVVKGFGETYYGLNKDGDCVTGKPGSIGVMNDGDIVFFPPNKGERVIDQNGKKVIISVDGKVKELIPKEYTKGFFTKVYYENDNGHVEFRSIEPNRELKLLSRRLSVVNSPAKARSCLTELFNSEAGQKAFLSNQFPASKESLLEFIDCYEKAIALEHKDNYTTAISKIHKQNMKREQRLLAIDEVRKFINELDPSDLEFKNKCCCSLQILGRIRERTLVTQRQMLYCGGFSILQSAWGSNPLKMAKISIELLNSKDREVALDTMVPGYKKLFKIAPDCQISKFSEPYIDSQLIAALYDIDNEGGTNIPQDSTVARYLGLNVQRVIYRAKLKRQFSNKDDIQKVFVNDLIKATKRQVPVSIRVSPIMTDCIKKNLSIKYNRKMSEVINLDKMIQNDASNANRSPQSMNNHAVIIEKIERVSSGRDTMLNLKIYTWGSVQNVQIKETEFNNYFSHDVCALINVGEDRDYDCFENLDDVVFYNFRQKGIVECPNGKQVVIAQGEKVSIDGFTYKLDKNGLIYQKYDMRNPLKILKAIFNEMKTNKSK